MTADEKNQRQQQPRDDEEYDIEIPAGIAPEAYYDSQLSPLRASLRRILLPYIRAETPILHSMQVNQPFSSSLLLCAEEKNLLCMNWTLSLSRLFMHCFAFGVLSPETKNFPLTCLFLFLSPVDVFLTGTGFHQLKVRHPILDVYFTTTAFSGNHTFFMIALPVLFWFGFSEIARGYVLYDPIEKKKALSVSVYSTKQKLLLTCG
jgi:hypothetical protein